MILEQKLTKGGFFHHLKNNYKNLPNALTGLALGLCGLSGVINDNISIFINPWIPWVAIPLFACVIILIILSFVRNTLNPHILLFEIKDPLYSSFMSTLSMTLMCLGGFIAVWEKDAISAAQIIGAIVMISGIILQVVILFYFFKNVVVRYKFKESSVYGSWFLPSVGLATAPLFSNVFSQSILPNQFFQAVWYFAFICYAGFFIFITYILLFAKKVEEEKFPSIVIYFAPAGLVAASYIQTFALTYVKSINKLFSTSSHFVFLNGMNYITGYGSAFIIIMFMILVAMSFTYSILLWTVFVVKILQQKFSYIFASLTFPTAINAITMTLSYFFIQDLMDRTNNNSIFLNDISWCFKIISYIFGIASTLLILYIAIRFIILLIKDLFKKYEENSLKDLPIPLKK